MMLYILNPRNGAVSTHSATPTHLVEHDGVLYGADSESLVSFDGEPDGVTLVTGELQVASGARGTVPRLSALLSTNGAVSVGFSNDDDGHKYTDGPFVLVEGQSPSPREWTTRLGRGHRGNAYQFTLSGEIDALVRVDLQIEGQPRDK